MDTLPDLTERLRVHQGARTLLTRLRRRAIGELITTDDPAWMTKAPVNIATPAGFPDLRQEAKDVLASYKPQTLLGRMTPLSAPPFVPVITPPRDIVGGWVGENDPVPAALLPLATERTAISKFGCVVSGSIRRCSRRWTRAGRTSSIERWSWR